MTTVTIVDFIERIMPYLLTILGTGGLLAFLRWYFGERQKTQSETKKLDTDALANLTKLVNELADELVKTRENQINVDKMRAEFEKLVSAQNRQIQEQNIKIAEIQALNDAKERRIGVLEREVRDLTCDRDNWRERWDAFAQKVKQLADNASAAERKSKIYLDALIANNIQVPPL
jgi:chromosome segregation ATPase